MGEARDCNLVVHGEAQNLHFERGPGVILMPISTIQKAVPIYQDHLELFLEVSRGGCMDGWTIK